MDGYIMKSKPEQLRYSATSTFERQAVSVTGMGEEAFCIWDRMRCLRKVRIPEPEVAY